MKPKPKKPKKGATMRQLLAEAERSRRRGDEYTGDVWGSKELRVSDAVWCPNCNHVFRLRVRKVARADRQRLADIEQELRGLAFEQGRLAECERALRRERFEIETRLSGGSGKQER